MAIGGKLIKTIWSDQWLTMTAVAVPFLHVTSLISKNFPAPLEEHDNFVPEDSYMSLYKQS